MNLIIIIGAIQGLICSLVLFLSKNADRNSRLLGAVILLISMACFSMYFLLTGLRNQYFLFNVFYFVLPLIIIMPVGPLLYLYTASFCKKQVLNGKRHFLPALSELIPYLLGLIFLIGGAAGSIAEGNKQSWINVIDGFHMYLDIPRWIVVSVYVYLSWRLLKHSKLKTRSWPFQLITGMSVFQVIWLTHLIPYIIPQTSDKLLEVLNWYPIYLPTSVLVYWLSINGYIQHVAKAGRSSYSTSGISNIDVSATMNILTNLMDEDQVFLDPKLTLQKVVDLSGLTQKQISLVLNQHHNLSFNDFVNHYRVNALKERLRSQGNANLTITGIAFECGFNSAATLNRVFKQIVGITPRAYQLQHSKKVDQNSTHI